MTRRKSAQLQIRVTPEQKRALRRLANGAGLDVSTYVLGRALPRARTAVDEILHALAGDEDPRFALAALADLLRGLSVAERAEDLADLDLTGLSPRLQNTVAAMVEHVSARSGVAPPEWTLAVEPLADPHFAVPFQRLRAYLLRSSPVAFKRRNLFVDSTLLDRV